MSKPIAVVDDERFDAHMDEGGGHPESPERLIAAREGLYSSLTSVEKLPVHAREASEHELTRIHVPRYVQRLRASLNDGYGQLDPDTYYAPGTREATWLAAGGGIDLTRAILDGRADKGFALLRPPGHHAVPERSMGFCLLNNVALAAAAALDAGLTRVAIVDWDVHHGNGTQDAFYDDPRVLFTSLHQFPFYPGTGAAREIGRGKGLGYTANLALPAGCGPEVYGAAFREVVLPMLYEYQPELVLVSAGFDAHTRDPLAAMHLDEATYAAMAGALIELVDTLGHKRIAFMLEGGYDLHALKQSVAAVGSALLTAPIALPEGVLRPEQRAAIEATKQQLAPHWSFRAR